MYLDISTAYVEHIPQIKGRIYIYALVDPRDNQVRWIGQTRQRCKDRYRQHLWSYHSLDFVSWASDVILDGLTIRMMLITETDEQNAFKDEQAMMRIATRNGHELLNIRDHRPATKTGYETVAHCIDFVRGK